MVTIKQIKEQIGEKNYERLKAAGIAKPNKLKNLDEEEVMTLANIGPKTAKKLFMLLGKRKDEKSLNKTYRGISNKRRFKNVKEKISRLAKNPQESIRKVEDYKEGATHLTNLLTSIRNFGLPESQKRQQVSMPPTPSALTPEGLYQSKEEQETQGFAFVEVHIKYDNKENNFIVSYDMIDKTSQEVWQKTSSKINSHALTRRVQLEIKETIEELLESIHSPVRGGGHLSVIIHSEDVPSPRELETYLQDQFRKEVQQSKMSILPSYQEFLEWEILIKYNDNKALLNMLSKLASFITFYEYEEYKKRYSNPMDFEEYKRKYYDPDWFWVKVKEDTRTSYVQIKDRVFFGVVEARHKDIRTNLMRSTDEWFDIMVPETYKEFESLKSGLPLNFEGMHIGQEVIAMINHVLGEKKIYAERGRKVILIDKKFPDWGFIIESGGGY